MKKFLSFLAAAAMLFTASCSNDDLGENEGGDALVSFSMNLDGVSSTKADIGKGTLVDQLQYAVFEITKDDAGNVKTQQWLHKYNTMNNVQWPAQVDIRLAKNKSYRVVFWAQDASCNAYTVTDDMNVTVDYAGINNDETRDAFFGYADLENVSGSIKQDVTLKRPFAQLNVGVTAEDWQGAMFSGVEMTHSTVTVNQVANTINLFNGEIGANNTSVTYTMAQRPNEQLYVDVTDDNVENFNEFYYLSMSYLLVEQNNVSADFTFSTAATGGHEISLNIPTVPVTRNHRTNILGQILTGNVTFNVYIDADFDGEYLEGALKIVNNREELQAALDAAQAGFAENIIVFGADITGDVYVHQKQNVNIIIDGRDKKYDGSIKIHNGSNYNNATLTIKDVNFETATESLNFIMPNEFGVENGVTRRYSNNILVENCTFTATGAAVNTAVGVQAKSTRNVTVLNCTATDMHSLIQAQSCGDNVVVKGCTINGKNGVAFKQVQNAVVEGTTITAAAYGIRYDGNIANYSITVKDNNVTAVQPFIVRKMTGANNTITLTGVNVLNPTDAPYQIVITNGSDDETYSIPTGTYTLTGAEDFIVYPDNYKVISTKDDLAGLDGVCDFIDNIDNGSNVTNINNKVVILNMENKELKAGGQGTNNYAFNLYGTDMIVNDANINGAGFAVMNESSLIVNSGKIAAKPGKSGRNMFYVTGNSTVTVNEGNYTFDRTSCYFVYVEAGSTCYINGGHFEKPLANSADKDSFVNKGSTGTVIIKGGTFNVDPTKWLAPGYKATKSGSTWTVAAE